MAILRESFLKVEKTPYVHKLNHYTCENCGTKGSVYLHYNVNGSIVMNSIKPAVVSDERSLCDQCGKEHLDPHFPAYIQEQFKEVHNEQKRNYDDHPNSLKKAGKRFVILMVLFFVALAIGFGYEKLKDVGVPKEHQGYVHDIIRATEPNSCLSIYLMGEKGYTSWMLVKTEQDSMYFRDLKEHVQSHKATKEATDPALYSDKVFGMAKNDLYEMANNGEILP